MGFKLTDGKAENLTVPDATVVNDGDLYRINGLNGFAIVDGIDRSVKGTVSATDTSRTIAFETDTNAVWYVKASAAVIAANPIVGALLYWATPGSFQDSGLHLVATPAAATDAPCCQVWRRKDPAGYIAVRVLNGGNGTA